MKNISPNKILFALAILLSVAHACSDGGNEGMVTQQKAIQIAETAFEEQFGGYYDLKTVQPYRIQEKEDYWLVERSLPEDMVGGVPVIRISKRDGSILEIYHTK